VGILPGEILWLWSSLGIDFHEFIDVTHFIGLV
jgi:hypothetical protein